MRRFFPPEPNYQSLSVRDLLEAREAYHVYLTNLENVIGTAIGKYRIRLTDPDLENPLALRTRPSRRSSRQLKISDTKLGKVQNSALIKSYTDKNFLPAYGLKDPELENILM